MGGGSGGHVTPVVAVLSKIRKRKPEAEIRFWCDKGFSDQANRTMQNIDSVRVDTIISGKFRRYHSLSIWRQLTNFRTIGWPNIVDSLKIIAGTIQSILKLINWRPDVVFTKGGFVCLPVGFAAHLLKIPLVIHDSDAHPGLTNRILSRWASRIGTGSPLEYYPYPKSVSRYIGIPVSAKLRPYNSDERSDLKSSLGFDADRPLVVITGGGLGAKRLNDATMLVLGNLTKKAGIMIVSGKSQYEELKAATSAYSNDTVQVHAFISEKFGEVLGAADLVVSRAGATTLLELAALAKPTVLIPNPYLTGGHQLKNAAVYRKENAVVLLDEKELEEKPDLLSDAIESVISDPATAADLGQSIYGMAKPNAANDMAELILEAIKL